MWCVVFVFCICMRDVYYFFFFKQKTAYEMRISDWSSDVCSSDLCAPIGVCTMVDCGADGGAPGKGIVVPGMSESGTSGGGASGEGASGEDASGRRASPRGRGIDICVAAMLAHSAGKATEQSAKPALTV